MLSYLNLTKPRISMLFAFTGWAAMAVEGSLSAYSLRLWMIVLAIFLVGGSANTFNQFFERDVDALMARTAKKRPLPQGKVKPTGAVIFGVLTAVIGNAMLYYWGSFWALFWGVFTLAFYSFYYTLWLKPRTPYNIVIGGAAGATGPLLAWSAVTGQPMAMAPFIMFLTVFLWTPPHFWALALCCKEDYKKVSYPMLPLVVGDAATKTQMVWYSLTMIPIPMALYFIGALGKVYAVSALILGVGFVWGSFQVKSSEQTKTYWKFFAYSILYLLLLFTMMIVDRALK